MLFMFGTIAVCLALADGPVKAQDAQRVDPPGTAGIMSRYRLWFAAADTNKDGMLNKEELARAFRGPNAKPFDYVPPPKEVKNKTETKDRSASEEKDKAEKSEKDMPARKRDYSSFPDYLFLMQLDVNNDEMISKEEFDNWARDLAVQLKTQLELQAKPLDLQIRLQQEALRLSAIERQTIEADMKRERDRLARLQQQTQKQQKYFNQSRRKPY